MLKSADLAYCEPSVEARRWLLGLSGGIVVAYVALFLSLLWKVGPVDQDQFLVFHELQSWNSSFFGIAKQWTPLMCGGLSLAGEPQVPFMSLSMMLAYLCGPFWALKVATALYFVAGWVGAYLYAGLWLASPNRDSSPRPCLLAMGSSYAASVTGISISYRFLRYLFCYGCFIG